MSRLRALTSGLGHTVTATALAAFALSAPLHAQDNAQDLEADAIEEIVVTGSRIKRANLVSTSPVTQIDSDEFLFQGITRVEGRGTSISVIFARPG